MKLTQDWQFGKKRMSLDMLMQRRLQPYSMQEAKLRLLPALRSLIQLHARGEAHGSIYPANIFVDEYGYFNLGKQHKKAAVNQLAPYLPLEQYAGEEQRTYSDVYALGAVLFFLVTHKEPDTVLARLQNDTLSARLSGVPFVSEQDRAVLLAAMAMKKEERLHDVGALINAMGLINELVQPMQENQVQPIQVNRGQFEVNQLELLQAPQVELELSKVPQVKPVQTEQSRPDAPQMRRVRRPISRSAVLITCAVLLLGAFGTVWMISGISYRQAAAYVEDGDYAAARTAITGTVVTYPDAKTFSYYINSGYFLELGYYDEAKERFSSLGDYRNAKEMALECDYQKALATLEQDDYNAAKKAFEALGGYSDAKNMALECEYRRASDLLKEKEYDQARRVFEKLADSGYRDADQMLMEANYQKAMDIYQKFVNANPNQRYEIKIKPALDLLYSIRGYSDADQKIILFENAIYHEAVSRFDKVVEFFQEGYTDAELLGASALYESYLISAQYYFSLVPLLGESERYSEVCKILSDITMDWQEQGEELMKFWQFEPARKIILCDMLINYFLVGSWKGDGRYFKVRIDDDGFNFDDNFIIVYESGYHVDIEDFVYSVGNDKRGWKKVARLSFTDIDTMNAYLFSSNKTYTLHRQ